MKLNTWNRIERRFAGLCKDLDDEIVYVDDFNEEIEVKSESKSEPKEQSIVLSK